MWSVGSKGLMAGSRGFTLLELLVVLMIAILMMSLVPPLLSKLGVTTELRGTARQLAAALRAARNEAVTRQQEASLMLDLERGRFQVTGREYALPDSIALKLFTAQSELVDEGAAGIRFFPDGSSTGGYIALSDQRVEYTVNVDWLTGRIYILDRTVAP